MSKQTNQTNQATQKEDVKKMDFAFCLYRKTSKAGNHYFTGNGLIGFYNEEKKNPKEPDLRISRIEPLTGGAKEDFASLWVQVSKDGQTTYLTGKVYDQRIIGFISKQDTTDQPTPYVNFYFDDRGTTADSSVGNPDSNKYDAGKKKPF